MRLHYEEAARATTSLPLNVLNSTEKCLTNVIFLILFSRSIVSVYLNLVFTKNLIWTVDRHWTGYFCKTENSTKGSV